MRGAWLLLLLLVGCSSTRYDALVADYEGREQPAYLGALLADSATGADPMAEVAAESASIQARWDKVLPPAEPEPAESATPPSLESLANSLDLPGLVVLVLTRNPGIAAAGESLRATRQQYPQALALDNVLKQYNAFSKQLDTMVGPQQHKSMMAMSFPFPDALALKGKLVSEAVEIAERKLEIARRDAVTEMREAYFDYLFVNQGISINREQQGLLEQMIAVAQTKVRTDSGMYQGLIMAQVELSKLGDAIITLEEQRETVVTRINTLLNRAPEAALAAPNPVPPPAAGLTLDAWYEKALAGRQELAEQRLHIARMKTMIELATRMANPDASLGASYFEDRMQAPAAFMPKRELDHSQTPWFGQRDAYIGEVRLRVGAMEQMLTAMEDKTRLAVKEAHFALDRAQRSITLYRDSLLPQAEQSLEAAAAGYRSGQTDFLTFLDAERTLLKFRLEEQRALRDQGVALARLDQLSGEIQ
jgi:cobalt-zinc-cadmium efflux system outer membrane protein